jgi:GTP-binding protein
MNVIDTGGLDEKGEMNNIIKNQVEKAVLLSDAVVFMIDGKAGLTSLDEHFAHWIRKRALSKSALATLPANHVRPKVILAINKTEGAKSNDFVLETMAEAYKLGFGEPILISAAHGDGMADLGLALLDVAKQRGCEVEGISKADRRKAAKVVRRRKEFLERLDKESSPVAAAPAELEELPASSAEETGAVIPAVEAEKELPEDLQYRNLPEDVRRALEANNFHEEKDRVIQVAIMGRPNVGKSTLLNALIGEERVITGPLPGLTRDAISVQWEAHGRTFRLIDTAGLTRIQPNHSKLSDVPIRKHDTVVQALQRKAAAVTVPLPGRDKVSIEENPSQFSEQIAELALLSSLQALRYAQVVFVVVDSAQGKFHKLDLQLIQKCYEEGRSVIVIANKADLLRELRVGLAEYEGQVAQHIQRSIHDFHHELPVIACSALTKHGVSRILERAIDTHEQYSKRVPTWVLNRWLKDTMVTIRPARVANKAVHCKYLIQTHIRPPTFLVFANVLHLPPQLETFILNNLQKDFQLQGVPIRLHTKKSKGRAVKVHLLKHGRQTKRGQGRGEAKGKLKKVKQKEGETSVDVRGRHFFRRRERRTKINLRRRRDSRLRKRSSRKIKPWMMKG